MMERDQNEMRGRDALKRAAYRSGLLSALHRFRNRRHLTVVMFHRVLAPGDPRWSCADPGYTVSDTLFEECLRFFKRHYSVVDLDTIRAAASGKGRLPDRALLITFDDGWADNAEYALPLLRKHGMSAVVFVVSGAVGCREPFWHDLIQAAWRLRRLGEDTFVGLWEKAGLDVPPPSDLEAPASIRALLDRLKRLSDADRTAALAPIVARVTDGLPPHMMSVEQLVDWRRMDMSVGCHGLTHTSLTEVAEPASELRQAREQLARLIDSQADGIDTMSFPNGRYSTDVALAAAAAGFSVLFTSDPYLTRELGPREQDGRLLGRIEIPGHEISGLEGSLRPELLALWLFTRQPAPAAERRSA
jgi:peptidoglycan/xylan/chitin deacetylase (PgdA/CDA1 family)